MLSFYGVAADPASLATLITSLYKHKHQEKHKHKDRPKYEANTQMQIDKYTNTNTLAFPPLIASDKHGVNILLQ